MSLFGKIANAIVRAAAQQSGSPGSWSIPGWLEGRPYRPDTSHAELVKKYTGYVYACANRNSTSCAQVPLRLYGAKTNTRQKALWPTKRLQPKQIEFLSKSPSVSRFMRKAVDVEEVLEHPLLTLLEQVNPRMNEFDLMKYLFLFLELTGNAYWYLLNTNGGGPQPDEIWPLFSQWVKIVPDKGTSMIKGYEYSANGIDKIKLMPDDIVHFWHINPKDTYYGMGPLQAAIVAADLGVSMNEYETALMKNRGQPDMAMVLPSDAGEPTEEQQERFYSNWRQRFGGWKKAGKLALLWGGADLKPLSLSPKEMAFLQGRKATLTEICAIFGVPKSKLETENVNRANAESGEYTYMKDTVQPRLINVEQKLNEQLTRLWDNRLFCAFDNPVPDDREFRLQQIKQHISTGYSSINQERQVDNQEPVAWGDVPILPMTMVPFGSTSSAEQVGEPQKRAKAKFPPLNHPTNFTNPPLERALVEYFENMKKDALSGFDRYEKSYGVKMTSAGDFISSWYDAQTWNGRLEKATTVYTEATLLNGATKGLAQITPDLPLDQTRSHIIEAMEKRQGRVVGINSTKIKSLRSAIDEGLKLGETGREIRKRIEDNFELDKTHASVIARTETIWAWNEGKVQGYVQSGFVTKKQWLASGDERSCDFCPQLDGKIVDVEGDYFQKGDSMGAASGAALSFEYENIGHPPLHPNCRCTIIPIIEEA